MRLLIGIMTVFSLFNLQASEIIINNFSGEYAAVAEGKSPIETEHFEYAFMKSIAQEEAGIKKLIWKDVNLAFQGQQQSLSLASLFLSYNSSSQASITGLSAICSGFANAMESCFNGVSKFQVDEFMTSQSNEYDQKNLLIEVAYSIGKNLTSDNDKLLLENSFELKNIDINLDNNKLIASIRLKGAGKIRFKGVLQYNEDENANTKKVSIRLDKVKAGIFSVHGRVFKELAKMESENFVIQKPWIYITLQ